MAVADVKVRHLGVQDILDLAEKRLQLYGDRDAWYDKLLTYYYGKQPQGGAYSPSILASSNTGRPLLRQVGESLNTNRTYTSQRLAPIVDDYAALQGRMPSSRVEVPDPSPQGEQRAELLTKYLYSTYEMSNLETQQAQAGFWLSGLGDSCYVLEPEPDELRVVWTVISPRNAYPSFYHGYRRFELYDLLTIEIWDPEDIESQLGFSPKSDNPKHCTVLNYTSPVQRSVVVGTDLNAALVKDAEWDLGFCPAAWVWNKVTGHMGMSDIGQSLSQQDFLDWAFSVWADGLVHMTYPLIGIRNPANVGGDLVVGPGSTVPLQQDGDIKAITTAGDPRAIESVMQQTLSDINTATGTSPVRQEGQMHGSIITGRAVHAVQGPQSTRMDYKQEVMGAAWRRLNSMTLQMQEKAPHLKAFEGDIYGRVRGESFQTRFSAKDDIQGWHRNQVRWDTLVGMNQQQKLQVAFEGMTAKIWDDLEARIIAGVEDPIGMRDRVRNMLREEQQMQQEMAGGGAPGGQPGGQPGQPPPGGAPPGGPPGQAPGQGAAPPPGAAPQIFRPPQQGQSSAAGGAGPPGTNAQGVSVKAIQNLLVALSPKLKGSVYAVGELALHGAAAQATLAINDSRDYSKVLEAVRTIDPKAKVRKVSEDKLGTEAIKVSA